MAKCFVIDVARCSGCYNCQLACKDEHCDNDWTPYAKPQPDIGQFWAKVEEHVCGTLPKVKIHYIAHLCNHCDNPACQRACPHEAIEKRDDGFVIINPAKCVGCGQCISACPYGAIYYNKELSLCQKCTGCAHLLDNGYKLPRCVEACPTDAMRFGEEDELADLIKDAVILHPEAGTAPRVYYRNIPGQFIAATVYDPVEQEVIIGAECRLTCGDKVYTVLTDDFGDFWFKDLPVAKFDLEITAKGFKPIKIAGIDTEKCVNLGDLPMEKE